MKLTFLVDDELAKSFDLALQLTGENKDSVIESLMKSYFVQAFSKTATRYQTDVQNSHVSKNYAKAVRKIPKWASKPMLIPSKIIRAYLLLLDKNGYVSYPELLLWCSDKENHPDEYVSSFVNNFAQMKFDDEKSHGKVFEVTEKQAVVLWDDVKEEIYMNKNKFIGCATVAGYTNRNNQTNLGRTDKRGTNPTNWLYKMRCEECLCEYFANGSDIHEKKCPACQGGANTGAE